MSEFFREDGLFWAFVFFFSIAFIRTQATYWLARYVAYAAHRHEEIRHAWLAKVAGWIRRSGEGRGVRSIERWGVFAVFASFFMSGTKTVVNAGAGLSRMRFGIYILPMTLGCVAHAIIYATVGWAAWTSAAKAAAGSPWGALAILLAVVVVVFAVRKVLRARKASKRTHTGTSNGAETGTCADTSDSAGLDAHAGREPGTRATNPATGSSEK